MVRAVLINDEVELWDEVQHFWRKKWRLREIEDPEDKEPPELCFESLYCGKDGGVMEFPS